MKAVKEVETCCVVDDYCNSPANLERPVPARGICFACGLHVCSKCSTKRKYYEYGVKRLCNNCQIEYDGNDKIVLTRLYRMAGYKYPAKCAEATIKDRKDSEEE